MAYRLFVKGEDRVCEKLEDTAEALKGYAATNPIEFTIWAYDRSGKFSYAFGGTAEPNKVTINGITTNNKQAEEDSRYVADFIRLATSKSLS